MKDYVIRALDKDKAIRVFVATTTNMVESARRIHNTTPVATAALGRTLTGAGVMGLMLKGEKHKISIQIKGDGPLKTVLAVANSKGQVKGYVGDPNVDLPLKSNGKLDVGNAVGKNGRMIIIRDLGLREPYIGQSKLISGEIAEDLTYYFASSEQQPSAVALGVLVAKDLSVRASGGYIVQILPNISEEKLKRLEEILNNAEPISKLIDEGNNPEEILEKVFGEFEMEIKEKYDINLTCDCSKERLESALISLGEKELREIIEEDGQAEVSCHFCNTSYNFNIEELNKLLEEAKK
ncbi:MAG: Hsp33 family molecular chaperone HslO [Firmicutes bacterium]|nr:Hsp33 family molecular chaperone HslO [Bacillota bacterium]